MPAKSWRGGGEGGVANSQQVSTFLEICELLRLVEDRYFKIEAQNKRKQSGAAWWKFTARCSLSFFLVE